MRKIFIICSILILLASIYFAFMNLANDVSVNIINSNMLDAQNVSGLSEQGGFYIKTINLGVYTFIILLCGLLVGSGTVYMFYDITKDKLKAYQRELEKTSISGSNNASRVEVLEAKIKTLEKAFDTVIDERKQLEVQIKTLNAEIDNLNKG